MDIDKAIEELESIRTNIRHELKGIPDEIMYLKKQNKDTSSIEAEQLQKEGYLEGLNNSINLINENEKLSITKLEKLASVYKEENKNYSNLAKEAVELAIDLIY